MFSDEDELALRALRRSIGWASVSLIMSGVNSVALVLLPAALAGSVDAVLHGQNDVRAAGLLTAVLCILAVSEALTQLAAAAGMARSTWWLQYELLRHILRLGLKGRDQFGPGDLTSRVVSNCVDAAGGASVIRLITVMIVTGVGGLVGLGLIDPILLLVPVLALPGGTLIARRFLGRATDAVAGYTATLGAIADRLTGALYGIRTIRASGTTDREISRVLAPLPDLARFGRAMWAEVGRVSWQGGLLAPIVQLTIMAITGVRVAEGTLPPGDILAASGYATLAMTFVNQSGVMLQFAKVRAGARRVAEVLGAPVARTGSASLPAGPGELVFREVTVYRDARAVLDRLDLRIAGGASVAVIGRSAVGKSTLAAVAGGLIEPDGGAMLLDGVPLTDLSPAVLRQEICFAFAEPALLGDTVADAVVFGRGELTRAETVTAAHAARADDFIQRFPAGYDNPLRDSPMSGGERQRIGLARAFARPARLLVMDDATSSLDTVTEAQVSKVLTESLAGLTRVIVGHRPSTAARCDLVAWLDGSGRVRALAPHRELWDDPEYRAVFQNEVSGLADTP
ncbi:MAG TPA: ABC transporter ATP-binding protein [Trebonia sp.]|nr:ABC transporter ATP-binding protein [Trebonia sp.]